MKLSLLFITHFVADFLLQSRKMGKNKSSSWKYLGMHISIIFAAFLPFGIKFAVLNALIHAIIDKNIWNLYKLSAGYRISKISGKNTSKFAELVQTWPYWEDHWFYATIGFDQLLHALTIIALTYAY